MTVDPRWERLMTMFDSARDLPESERAAWLARACPDDLPLREEIECMLAADQRPGVLDRPLPDLAFDPTELPAGLSDRYTIERPLGEGGMARVYLARESKHGRQVALKVLKPEVAGLFGSDRFLREVRILAQLAHPHIVGLIDSGDADGVLYYVMPYLEGETLRDRLHRLGPLEPRQAIALLRDVADALRHAHQSGVVHRDLKPGNILCVADHAFVLDFGIAKLLEPVSRSSAETQGGTAIGTPAYMAPEQRVGDPQLDHRADLFSWGVVAYECLTGRLPEVGWVPVAVDDILTRRQDIPRRLAALVAACLSADPAARPADADTLVKALSGRVSSAVPAISPPRSTLKRSVLAAAAVGLIVLVGATLLNRSRLRPAPSPGVRAPIAVAQLVNETGDPSLDTWGRLGGDWITEGLQTASAVPVVPWPTALEASEQAQAEERASHKVDPVALMRRETGAGTVISGSYYRVGDSLRFHAAVNDAVDGRVIGSLQPVTTALDKPEVGIAELRRRLMGMIALSSNELLGPVPGMTRRPPTIEAYQAFDQGLARFRDQDYGPASTDFLRAYALDSGFVAALLYATTAFWNHGDVPQAESLLVQMSRRQGELSEYQLLRMASIQARVAGDAQKELASLRRGVAIAPHAMARYNLADAALNADRPDEALEALAEIDPNLGDMRGWAPYWTNLTHALHLTGDHVREAAAARELRRRHPDRRAGLVFEVRALAAVGDTAGIERILQEGQNLPPNTYWSQGAALVVAGEELQAHGYGQAGWPYLSRAVRWLDRQLELTPGDRPHRYWLASALYDLGDWHRAQPVAQGLVRDFPDRLVYRTLAAVCAARLRQAGADNLLGPMRSEERGEHTLARARLAAIRGNRDGALALFNEATRYGVQGLPWLHASAVYDLFLLGGARAALPASLRAGLKPTGPRPPAL